jgi:hypothetical protein
VLAELPHDGQADFEAVVGTADGIAELVDDLLVCETTYGTPIEAPSKLANIRGRLANIRLSTADHHHFRPADRDLFANGNADATSATSRFFRATRDELLRRTCRL